MAKKTQRKSLFLLPAFLWTLDGVGLNTLMEFQF